MTQESFVKRAPEIAEGILAKVAALPVLPEGLRSFSKDLMSKEASSEEEKLQSPKRMTLAELQKLASGNKVDLPKVASVSTDSSSEIVASLRKIADRHEQENAEDVFAAAAAIVAHSKEAAQITGAAGEAKAMLKALKPSKAEARWSWIPGTVGAKKVKAQKRYIEEITPGERLREEAIERSVLAKRQEGLGEAAKERTLTMREIGKGLPALGIGTAAAVAAPHALSPGKREKIQVVK